MSRERERAGTGQVADCRLRIAAKFMHLSKYQGLGNDFLLVDRRQCEQIGWELPGVAHLLCDRHYGIGADGLIEISPTPTGGERDCRVRIFNSDGSEAEISGNGVRCVAAHWLRTQPSGSPVVRVDTVAGVKVLELLERDGNTFYFWARMGQPVLRPDQIPMRLPETAREVLNYPLPCDGRVVHVTAVSMGNPHCSILVGAIEEAQIGQLGPRIENHPAFPEKTNVEFVRVLGPGRIRVWFWERGVGRTLSSGTGSCAAALAAIRAGHARDRVLVVTDAGPLEVRWQANQEVRLKGSAELVCEVDFHLPKQSLCRRVM